MKCQSMPVVGLLDRVDRVDFMQDSVAQATLRNVLPAI